MRSSWFLMLLVITALCAGCGGLPEEIERRAEALPKEFQRVEDVIAARKAAFEATRKSALYGSFLRPYAEREQWHGAFVRAEVKLAEARQIADTDLKEVMDRNNEEEFDQALLQLKRVGAAKREALELVDLPEKRAAFLEKARAEAPQWLEKARAETKRAGVAYAGMLAAKQKAAGRHPQRTNDIEKRLQSYKNSVNDLKQHLEVVESEKRGASPDYAKFGDACSAISKTLLLVVEGEKLFKAQLAELDRSYSKTLTDMRAHNLVQVGRTSWEESEMVEWPRESEYLYPAKPVDPVTYEYFEKFSGEVNLATLRRGFGGPDFHVEAHQWHWDQLVIDRGEQWPSGDNEADYYVADLPVKYYHKYLVVENGKKSETDWVEIDEAMYEKNEDNLGMDIEVKPYGSFGEETIREATPAGMAYVDNPAYGSWVNGPNGGFWQFYGMYRMMDDLIPGGRYHRNDYQTWLRDYRGRKPYYGPKEDEERYGSGSVYVRTRYAGSTYGRTGGFLAMDSAVRGAGPSGRGGGPGGGGK